MGQKGALHLSGHLFGEITAPQGPRAIEHALALCTWVQWWPLDVVDARVPGNQRTDGLGS